MVAMIGVFRGPYQGVRTEYRGRTFRSRLEAEWAYHFDQTEVRWVYEPCRIRLAGGRAYTPDFALPDSRALVEVKPTEPTAAEFLKAAAAADILGGGVWFYCGPPWAARFWSTRTYRGRSVFEPAGGPGGEGDGSEPVEGGVAMAMLTPDMGKPQRDVAEYQFPTGMYLVRLTGVEEIGPSAKYPKGNPRLVFEFTVWEGPYRGKRAAQFVGKTLFKDPKTNKESALIKLARSMGVVNPELGFDPDALKGKFFNAMCEQDQSTPDGRTWVRAVTPAGAPTAPTPAAVSAPPPPGAMPPPPPAALAEPADDSRWQVWDGHNKNYCPMTAKQVRAYMHDQKCGPADVQLAPDGSQEVRTADRWGFSPIPF